MAQDEALEQLKAWFDRDFRYAKWDRDVELVSFAENGAVRIRVYTDLHCYAICARPGRCYAENEPHLADYPASYLGCQAGTRKPRAGEDHTRGNDLADGPLNEQTWHRILADIVSYEMVAIAKQARSGVVGAESGIPVAEERPAANGALPAAGRDQ